MTRRILTTQELVVDMLKEACRFVEFYTENELHYYNCSGDISSRPKRFHPGVADKFLLRKLIEERIQEIPTDLRDKRNVPAFAHRVLFDDFYSKYI